MAFMVRAWGGAPEEGTSCTSAREAAAAAAAAAVAATVAPALPLPELAAALRSPPSPPPAAAAVAHQQVVSPAVPVPVGVVRTNPVVDLNHPAQHTRRAGVSGWGSVGAGRLRTARDASRRRMGRRCGCCSRGAGCGTACRAAPVRRRAKLTGWLRRACAKPQGRHE